MDGVICAGYSKQKNAPAFLCWRNLVVTHEENQEIMLAMVRGAVLEPVRERVSHAGRIVEGMT
jgi:hypothetical protein